MVVGFHHFVNHELRVFRQLFCRWYKVLADMDGCVFME